ERKNTDSDGSGKPVQWHGHRNRRYVRTGSRMGDIQWRPYVHVRGELLCAEDTGALSGALLCGHNRESEAVRRADGRAGYAGQSGTASACGWRYFTENG